MQQCPNRIFHSAANYQVGFMQPVPHRRKKVSEKKKKCQDISINLSLQDINNGWFKQALNTSILIKHL